MKLKKCASCKTYTLKTTCPKCKKKTKDAHYKFKKQKPKEN
jgi:rRNA maturation protein Nop10